MGFGRAILDAKIWQIVRNIRPALLKMARIAVDRVHVKDGRDWRKNGALQPGRRFAVRTESGLEIHRSEDIVVVELDVVFACPNYLHRPAQFFRQYRGLSNEIRLRLTAKSSTEKGY